MADKKRSIYTPGNDFDFPEQILDRKKFGYRWVSAERFESNSDEYESRGWSKFRDAEGKTIRHKDCFLAQMPIDQWEAMVDFKNKERDEQTAMILERQAAENATLEHEFKKAGGKVKFSYTQG